MILIIGGKAQGKAAYAHTLEKDDRKILLNAQEWIRRAVLSGETEESFAARLLQDRPEIITMDEVGCGIVPLDKKERDYREAVGHVGQQLAAEADMVIRMVAGIPTVIKQKCNC